MRILHVLDHSLPTQSGYAIRSAAILREQRSLGIETIQVTGPKQGLGAAESEVADGIAYLRTPDPTARFRRSQVTAQLRVISLLRRRLREIVVRERPDIIHAHSPCLNAIAALGLGKPMVYELRSSWEDAAVSTGTTTEGSLRYRASRWLETYVLRRASAVTTICEGLRQDAIGRGVAADRVTVIANAVDATGLSASASPDSTTRDRLGLRGAYVLGFIGSFFAWEGLTLLIEALPRILVKRPDARVLLVGGGEREAMLRDTANRLGLAPYVVFAGQVPHAEVSNLYSAIDLLVYPRLSMRLTEMVTPLKPLEAMALGKALVASNVGGHRELIVDGSTGILFGAGKADALSAAVLRVMDSPDLQRRLCENGPRYVREHRTWQQVVAGYDPVYRRLMSGGGA